MTFVDLIAEPIARYVIMPIATCLVNLLINYSSKCDKNQFFSWKMCNWGPSLITTNLLLIITDLGQKAQYDKVDKICLSNSLLALLLTFLLATIMSLVIRKHDFYREYHHVYTIHLPNIIGVISLFMSYSIIY